MQLHPCLFPCPVAVKPKPSDLNTPAAGGGEDNDAEEFVKLAVLLPGTSTKSPAADPLGATGEGGGGREEGGDVIQPPIGTATTAAAPGVVDAAPLHTLKISAGILEHLEVVLVKTERTNSFGVGYVC
jgi:hypothetical protein